MRKTLSVIALALLAACSSSATGAGEDTDGLQVRTGQRVYALPAGGSNPVTVPFTATNTGSAMVSIARCGTAPSAELQRRGDAGWVSVSSGVCTANVDMSPARLAPGEGVAGVAYIDRISGTYRIRVPVSGSAPTPAVARYSVSPTFEVRWTDG